MPAANTSVVRTIFPKQIEFADITWDKDFGGPVSIDIEVGANAVMDATGEDQTFSFLGFSNFVNSFVLRLHDTRIYETLQIGMNGAMFVNYSIPATSTPTQDAADVSYEVGYAYITSFHISQSFGSVGEVVINGVCQPPEYSVPGPVPA